MVQHPLVERYMSRFEASITELNCPEPQEIVEEIRNHIAEARSAGKSLDAILEALGPADVLARAYAIELTLNPHRSRQVEALGRFVRVAGMIAAGSLATLIVVGALGSVGIGFSASGLTMFVIGVLESAEVHVPGVQMNGISPIWAIVLGPFVLAVGLASLVGLRAYLRFIVRTLRRVLPRAREASTIA